MSYYIAIDPGGSTGVAYYDLESREITSDQLETTDHHVDLYKMFYMLQPKAIICERFDYRNTARPGLVLDSREYIGICKLYCALTDTPLVLQTAAQAKVFVNDAILDKLELYSSGMPHANDAVRHLLFFLTNNTLVPKEHARLFLNKGWR